MQSYIDAFTLLYDALAEDILAWCPSLIQDVERDLSRLHISVRRDGLSFMTITHGHMEKAFLKALSGEVDLGTASQLVRGMGSKKRGLDVRPRYMHGLFSMIFDDQGTLRPDVDPVAVFFLRQWFSLAKKIEIECTPLRVSRSIDDWISVDEKLPIHHPNTWDDDAPVWQRRLGHPLFGRIENELPSLFSEDQETIDRGPKWTLLWELFALITGTLGILDPWSIRPKHGPGATADRDGLKYEFRNWPAKLQSIFPWDFFATPDLGVYRRESGTEPVQREVPCVMNAVPKTQEAPRLIALEPIAHQWIQGGIQRWFEDQVERSWLSNFIDFRNQSKSQKLARWSSLTGECATVDLSAASDRVSTRLVEYAFQTNPGLLDALHACRSRLVKLPDGTLHRMRKFAPMGSAVCFPVQTIVFTGIALASVALTRGLTPREAIEASVGYVQVFGDDIIIPVDSYPALVAILTELGLKVNEAKSYHTGFFREACGMDAYKGDDVTPARIRQFYSKSDPSSLKAVVDTSNNFYMKGLWHLSAALLKTVPQAERKLLPIGMLGDGAVSLFSFQRGWEPARVGWDSDFQRRTTRAITTSNRNVIQQSDGEGGLTQFFFEEPSPEEKYSSGQVVECVPRKSAERVLLD